MVKQSNEPQNTSANAYEREFVRTVLRLNGVVGVPTNEQLDCATQTLEEYGIRVADARRRDLVLDFGWLKGRMPEQAAVERAFLFVRFDSVLKTTGAQSRALLDWLKMGQSH
ncbi:MAG: hypothetical protein ABIP38_06655 [Steroidobacteraceae bacterium]